MNRRRAVREGTWPYARMQGWSARFGWSPRTVDLEVIELGTHVVIEFDVQESRARRYGVPWTAYVHRLGDKQGRCH